MDGTTSAVSLITFAIQGVKFILQTVSTFKNGPEEARKVASNAQDLLEILQRLEHSPTVEDGQDDKLEGRLKECRADVDMICQDLDPAGKEPSGRFVRKVYQTAKSVSLGKEGRWKEYQARLNKHSIDLGTLMALRSNEKLDHMNHNMVGMDEKLDQISRKICEALSRLYTRLDSVKTNVGANSTNLIQNCPANRKAQHVIDSIHELLQSRSRLLEGVSSQGAEPAEGIPRGGRVDQLPDFINELSSYANQLSDRIDQLSHLRKQNKDNEDFESQPLWDIIDEIAILVENLKCVIREANSMEATWRQATPHDRVVETSQRQSRTIYIQNNYFAADLSNRPSLQVLPILPETTRKSFSLPVLPHVLDSKSSDVERCTIDMETGRRPWNRDVAVQHSSVLKTFFSPDRVCLADAAVRSAPVSKQTLARLTRWSQPNSPARMLWMKGPYTPARNLDNPLTRLAAKLATMARQSGVPFISYFCPLTQQTPCMPQRQHGKMTESAPLTALLYALIWQVVQLLPPLFESEMDLSAELFERLARAQLTWEDVLAILKDIVALVPGPMFCILEGVQRLEQSNTNSYLSKFIAVLRELGGGLTRMHVLLVTTGTSTTLRDAIPTNETCNEEYLGGGGFREDLARHSDKFWL